MITREQALADIALADTLANEDIFEVLCKFRNDGSHERTLLDFISRARAALPEYARQYMKAVDLLSEIYFDSEGVDNKIRGKIQAMVAACHGRDKP